MSARRKSSFLAVGNASLWLPCHAQILARSLLHLMMIPQLISSRFFIIPRIQIEILDFLVLFQLFSGQFQFLRAGTCTTKTLNIFHLKIANTQRNLISWPKLLMSGRAMSWGFIEPFRSHSTLCGHTQDKVSFANMFSNDLQTALFIQKCIS